MARRCAPPAQGRTPWASMVPWCPRMTSPVAWVGCRRVPRRRATLRPPRRPPRCWPRLRCGLARCTAPGGRALTAAGGNRAAAPASRPSRSRCTGGSCSRRPLPSGQGGYCDCSDCCSELCSHCILRGQHLRCGSEGGGAAGASRSRSRRGGRQGSSSGNTRCSGLCSPCSRHPGGPATGDVVSEDVQWCHQH